MSLAAPESEGASGGSRDEPARARNYPIFAWFARHCRPPACSSREVSLTKIIGVSRGMGEPLLTETRVFFTISLILGRSWRLRSSDRGYFVINSNNGEYL